MATIYAVNTKTGATSKFDIESLSMSSSDGVTYIISSDDLMQLDGDDDLGTDIACSFSTGFIDFNTDALKRLTNLGVYVSFLDDASGTFKAEASVNGIGADDEFTVPFTTVAPEMTRLSVPDGLKGRYWRFTFTNSDGSPFSVQDIQIHLFSNNRVTK